MKVMKNQKNQNQGNSQIPYGLECHYSFWDLSEAALGIKVSKDDKKNFLELSQNKKNEQIKHWADTAGWVCEDRRGSDGKIYTAFAPKKEKP